VPDALNCPVLDDEERAYVGTLYKQVSPFDAKKIGAALVSKNIAQHIEERFRGRDRGWRPLVYCCAAGSAHRRWPRAAPGGLEHGDALRRLPGLPPRSHGSAR